MGTPIAGLLWQLLPLRYESSIPSSGVSPKTRTPELSSTFSACLRTTLQSTYWIFLVKFLETMPPSCCFSSCLPGRQKHRRVSESTSLGPHSGFGLEFKSCSAVAFFGSLGVVWRSGFVWRRDSSPPPRLAEAGLIRWAAKRTLVVFC